jgi:hypothetical protein
MSDKVTYHDVMSGVWGRNGRQRPVKSDAGCQPRSGGAPIRLPKVDRKAAFAKIVAQNKGEV